MIRLLNCAPLLSIALSTIPALAVPLLATTAAHGDETVAVQRVADHCTRLGQGYVDVGNGMCTRVAGHLRVDLGARNAALNSWASNGTSNAALRSGGPSMVPGVTTMEHLRIHGSLDSFGPIH